MTSEAEPDPVPASAPTPGRAKARPQVPGRSPRGRGPRPRGLTLVLTGVAGVLVGVAIFAVVVRVAGTRAITGPTAAAAAFDVGSAEQRARAIARDRTPLLFGDPLGDGRDIYVQHLGEKVWVAFDARAPGAPAPCLLRWERGPQHLVDPCDGRVYPPDGAGLVTYPARVTDDDHLLVDLRSPRAPGPAPTSPTPAPTTPAATTAPREAAGS